MDEVDGDESDAVTGAGRAGVSERRRRYVGSRITRLREARGLSLEELAQRVGLLAGVMKAVESGRRGVTFECLIDIANALGVTASELLEGME
ncbi:helix-turn-helix transcriptional regulator [Mycolicibacterium neoaurum]|uniref:helix-turn-helix domain-containing protein n=1 Tax=Mycolicibacterium neoaurum TaxID=1795 RepID=UPI001BCC901D|nr:helix-turn-helix transcriptional regulator [Mycolicibacterium neoaurum]QVI27350.1 helix-turn-helix transcriptional regulator [Mycolicibacterium neoaurum]